MYKVSKQKPPANIFPHISEGKGHLIKTCYDMKKCEKDPRQHGHFERNIGDKQFCNLSIWHVI